MDAVTKDDPLENNNQGGGVPQNQAAIDDNVDTMLTEEIEKTIEETAMREIPEEDLDEAVRNFANLANTNFDEFEDDPLDNVPTATASELTDAVAADLNAAVASALAHAVPPDPTPPPQDVPTEPASDLEDAEIEMLPSSSEIAAPFVVKEEPTDVDDSILAAYGDLANFDSIENDTPASKPEPQHEESLMPNIPSNFLLKSFDWEENNSKGSVKDEQEGSAQGFGIKIRSDLLQKRSPSPEQLRSPKKEQESPAKEPEIPQAITTESECSVKEPEVTKTQKEDFMKSPLSDSEASEASSVQVEKKKRGRKKKEVKERELAEAAARKRKLLEKERMAGFYNGVRLMEHGTPVQWLVDRVRVMLREVHLYSAADLDRGLEQLTTQPCIIRIRRLKDSEIIAARKQKRPPQNYMSPKVKANRTEVLDLDLAKEEMSKAYNAKASEMIARRDREEKEKSKKKKRQRLISSDDDSDVEVKPKKVGKKDSALKEKQREKKDSESVSGGERSRESSVSRSEVKSRDSHSRDLSEERSEPSAEKKSKKDLEGGEERSDSRSEERSKKKDREEQKKELRDKEREIREKELREKEREHREKEREQKAKEKERREKEKEKLKKEKQEKAESKPAEPPKPLQTPSFKIPKKAVDTSKPTKDVREFSILPEPRKDERRTEKKVIQKVQRVEKRTVMVERGAQTNPISCLRNYSGPTVEDLMLLLRQQIREAPIILARWSRNPPVAAEDLVRFQRERQKSEAEKYAKLEAEKRREIEKLKQRISVNDYKNRKHTPRPLSKIPHAERKHHEAQSSSRHRAAAEAAQIAVTNGTEASNKMPHTPTEEVGQKIGVVESNRMRPPIPPTTPDEEVPYSVEDEPMSYTPPGNSPGSPPPANPEPSKENAFDINSIVKTGCSFLPTAENAQTLPREVIAEVSASLKEPENHMSLEERLRQHSTIVSSPFQGQMPSAPQPVPAPVRAHMVQNSPQAVFAPGMLPSHVRTPPQLHDSSRSPAVSSPGFPYNSPNAFATPQPVPAPVPVPPPSMSQWSTSNKLQVQDFDRQLSGLQLPSLYRDTSEEVSFWNMIREEYGIPDFLLNKCLKDMMGPPGCKTPRCPNVHEMVSVASYTQLQPASKILEHFFSIRQKKFIIYYQTCFEEVVKKVVRGKEPRLLLCLCYEVMFREEELGQYWWNRLLEALLQLADDIREDNCFEVKRVLIYVMRHKVCTTMLRNDCARLSVRTYHHLPDVLNELFRDREYVAHKSIVELLVEHLLLNKEQSWVKLAVEILVANVSETVWRCFKQGVIHNLANMCGEVERNSLYMKSGRMPPNQPSLPNIHMPPPSVVAHQMAPAVAKPPLPMPPVPVPQMNAINPPMPMMNIRPPMPVTSVRPPLASTNPPLPPLPSTPQPPPPPPPASLIPPPLPPTLLFKEMPQADFNRPYSPSEKADDELDDPSDLDHNVDLVNKMCMGHEKPELIKDLYARMIRAINSEDFARVCSIVLRHPGDKLPRGRVLYSILKDKMQRPSQGFLKIATSANAQAGTQPVLLQKFHILLGTVGINILLDLVDQDIMTDALSVYITTKTMTKLNWENITTYRDGPITLEQILLKSCKMCFRMGQTQEAFDLLKRFNQTTGSRGTKDLLDVLELLVENFVNEGRFKESLLLWTNARDTKLRFCQANNLPRDLPKNTNILMVKLLNNNDNDIVQQLWKEMRDFPQCLDKKTTRAVVYRLCKINIDFALDAYHAGRLNSAYPPQMTNHRLVKVFSYWTLEEVMVVLEDVLRKLECNMTGTDISDFSLNIMLEELPEPPLSSDTIEDVTMPFVENSLRSLQTRVDEALSSMKPPVVLNPVADQKVLRANPVSLRCHLVQRRVRAQRMRQLKQQQQQAAPTQ